MFPTPPQRFSLHISPVLLRRSRHKCSQRNAREAVTFRSGHAAGIPGTSLSFPMRLLVIIARCESPPHHLFTLGRADEKTGCPKPRHCPPKWSGRKEAKAAFLKLLPGKPSPRGRTRPAAAACSLWRPVPGAGCGPPGCVGLVGVSGMARGVWGNCKRLCR